MANKRKQNKFGHAFVCEWLGTEWFRDDQGKITNEQGNYAGDKFNQIINEQYPVVAPVELEKRPKKKAKVSVDDAKPTPDQYEAEQKPKKRGRKKKEEEPDDSTRAGRLSRALLKGLFPGIYDKAEGLGELWKGDKDDKDQPSRTARLGKAAFANIFPGIAKKAAGAKKLWKGGDDETDQSEKKRQDTEKRFQYTRVEDTLKENADLLRDVIAVQERSSEILSQIANSIGKMSSGDDSGNDGKSKGFDWKKLLGKGKGVLGAASALMSIPSLDKDNVDSFLNPKKEEKTDSIMDKPITEVLGGLFGFGGDKKKEQPATTTAPVMPSAPAPTVTGQSLAQKAETSGIEEARNRGPKPTQTAAEDIISFKADQIKFNAERLTFEVQSLNVEMKQPQGQQAADSGGATPGGVSATEAGPAGGGGGGSGGATPGGSQATQTGAPAVAGPSGQLPTGKGVSEVDKSAPTYTPGSGRQNIPSAAPAAEGAPSSGSSKPLAGGKSFSEQAPEVMAKLQKDFGLSKEQAAGVVGNLGHESAGLQAGIQEKGVKQGRGGLGWAQWTGPRRREFEAYLKETGQEATDPNANYGFLKKELETTHKSSLTALKKETTVAGATKAFEAKYEAAGVKHMASRENYANQAMKLTDEAEKKKVAEEAKAQTAQKEAEKEETVQQAGTTSAPAAVQQQQAGATKASETAPNQTPTAPPPEVAEKLEAQTQNPVAEQKVAEAAKPGTTETRVAEQTNAPPIVIAAGGQPTTPPKRSDTMIMNGIEVNKPKLKTAAELFPGMDPNGEGVKKAVADWNAKQIERNPSLKPPETVDAKPEMTVEDKKALAGEDLSQPNAVSETSSLSAPADNLAPPEEPAAAPTDTPAQTDSGETPQASVEKPADKPSATGGEFIGKLSRTLPYLAMAVVTGQQQALHSVNQHLQARR